MAKFLRQCATDATIGCNWLEHEAQNVSLALQSFSSKKGEGRGRERDNEVLALLLKIFNLDHFNLNNSNG